MKTEHTENVLEEISETDMNNMKKFDITIERVNYFHYKTFRYSNLKDAIAQAKRGEIKEKSEEK